MPAVPQLGPLRKRLLLVRQPAALRPRQRPVITEDRMPRIPGPVLCADGEDDETRQLNRDMEDAGQDWPL
ncbi:hypothetical protein ABZ820_22290 [Streptomyces diacarni]|uniref:hypothetical protein n=1 Tax=Streptomyces diacarni TaxID=2800381 RepID=UPI00340AD0FB